VDTSVRLINDGDRSVASGRRSAGFRRHGRFINERGGACRRAPFGRREVRARDAGERCGRPKGAPSERRGWGGMRCGCGAVRGGTRRGQPSTTGGRPCCAPRSFALLTRCGAYCGRLRPRRLGLWRCSPRNHQRGWIEHEIGFTRESTFCLTLHSLEKTRSSAYAAVLLVAEHVVSGVGNMNESTVRQSGYPRSGSFTRCSRRRVVDHVPPRGWGFVESLFHRWVFHEPPIAMWGLHSSTDAANRRTCSGSCSPSS